MLLSIWSLHLPIKRFEQDTGAAGGCLIVLSIFPKGSNSRCLKCQKDPDPVGKVLSPLPTFSQNVFVENHILASMKHKLQLFPIDDGTWRALEMVTIFF